MAVIVGLLLTVKVVMGMRMGVVVGVGMGMLVGMGNTVMGMFMGVFVGMFMGMPAGNMVVIQMHSDAPCFFVSVYRKETGLSKRFFFQKCVADVSNGIKRAKAKHNAIGTGQLDCFADTFGDLVTGSGGSADTL